MTFQEYGSTANRDYFHTVQPGTYIVEMLRKDYGGGHYFRATLPSPCKYYGPQGSDEYESTYKWTGDVYRLGYLAQKNEGRFSAEFNGPKTARFEMCEGVDIVQGRPMDHGEGNFCHLEIAGERI